MKQQIVLSVLLSLVTLAGAIDPAGAQEDIHRITLDEAVQLFEANGALLRAEQMRIDAARGERRTAGLWTNPSLSFSREVLSTGDSEYSENVLGVEHRVELFRQRSLRKRVAESNVRSAEFRFEETKLGMLLEVKRAYLQCALMSREVTLLRRTAEVFRRAAHIGTARLDEGDISGFALLRLKSEEARYEADLAYAEIELEAATDRLAALLSPAGSHIRYEPTEEVVYAPLPFTVDQALSRAMRDRPDLHRTESDLQGLESELRLARREYLPSLDLFAGYKEQADDLAGPVFGATLSLPIFDRGQGRIDKARADVSRVEAQRIHLEKQVEADIRAAYARARILGEHLQRVENGLAGGPQRLLEIAEFAYGEGRMSLLELLDATEAFFETQRTHDRLRYGYAVALFELEKVLGSNMQHVRTRRIE